MCYGDLTIVPSRRSSRGGHRVGRHKGVREERFEAGAGEMCEEHFPALPETESMWRDAVQFDAKSLYQPVNRTRIIQKISNTSEDN